MITHERLLEILHYEPETGVFTWRVKTTHRVNVGARAGSTMKARGRMSARWALSIDGKNYLASRVAWFYMTGAWPIFEIDHKNTNSLDDSWDNLRQSTRQQNEINKGRYRNNRAGFKGVYAVPGGKFRASIHRNYKRKSLGAFDTPEAAGAAYAAAAMAIDGQFARSG